MQTGDVRLFSSHKRKRLSPELDRHDDCDNDVDVPFDRARVPRPLADGVFPQEDVAFERLGLTQWLSNTCRVYGMLKPTDVQAVCIPYILEGRPVIGVAQTGSGKTATFALPILQKLAKDPYGVFALVLTPTRSYRSPLLIFEGWSLRELAFQIGDIFGALAAGMTYRQSVIVGGLKLRSQVLQLARRPHVVISTPGRLAVTSLQPPLNITLLVDEADQILDVSFENDLRAIMSILPLHRQTLLFSATMTKNLIKLQKTAMPDAFVYQIYEGMQTVSTLKQQYVFIPQNVKNVYLYHLLQQLEDDCEVDGVIVFASSCASCKLLGYTLQHLSCDIVMLHSDLRQRQRLHHLEAFKSRRVKLMVATDLASRGLDIPSVDVVINFDLPHLPRDYVHRVGRTARAGRSGRAISFVTQYDIDLLHSIEKLIDIRMDAYDMEEANVLKSMRRVFVARKAATLQLKREQKNQKNDSEISVATQRDARS